MWLFFQVLGIVCSAATLLALVLIGGLLLLRRKFRKALEGFPDLPYAGTPARLHLRSAETMDWQDAEAAQALIQPLRAAGFDEIGGFTPEEMPFLRMWALMHVEQGIYAVVYEHPTAGVWVDLVSRYEDGTSITFANTGVGAQMDQRPGHGVVRAPDLDAVALYQRLVAERPQRPVKATAAADFKAAFETAYADGMDWRNSRGGPTDEEIRATAEAQGNTLSEEDLATTRSRLAQIAADGLTEAIQERFLATTTLSAAEWEDLRESVVIVHDRLTPEMLVCLFTPWSDDDEDEDEPVDGEAHEEQRLEDAKAGAPREVFARWNDALPDSRKLKLVGRVAEPIAGDLYSR